MVLHRRLKARVYPTGLLADLHQFTQTLRTGQDLPGPAALTLLAAVWRGWRWRVYWSGFRAEAENVGHIGIGWTRKRALRVLHEMAASRIWMRHQACGTTRLTSTRVRRPLCHTCKVRPPRVSWEPVWEPLPRLVYDTEIRNRGPWRAGPST